MPRDYYESRNNCLSTVLRDKAGFWMGPHIDNSHIMMHIIVNLMRDYETATEFYTVDSLQPVYRAPTKRNHGVIFVNTPGVIHAINGVTDTRWIWYGGIAI